MVAAVDRQPDFSAEGSRVGFNVAALVAARFCGMALIFIQNGIIFRELGEIGSGQYNFALGYSSLFTIFATLGIERMLVRDIARDPKIAWTHAWSATVLVLALTTVVLALVAGSIFVIEDNPRTRAAVILASLSIVGLWALQRPFEALIMARERMGMLAAVSIAAAVLKLAAVIAVLKLEPFAAALHLPKSSATVHGAIAAANCAAFLLYVGLAIALCGIERPRVRLGLVFKQIRECFPFAVAMLFSLLYFKFDITLLQVFRGDADSGIYAPTQRLMEPLLMVAGLWGAAVFPALCRLSQSSPANYAKLKHATIRLALLLAFPMAVGIAILAEPIILLFTGNAGAFHDSIFVLRLYAFVIPFFYFNGIAQEFFYSAHRNWFVVRVFGCAAAVSILGNLLAIPLFGVPGLAVVALVANASITAVFTLGMRPGLAEAGLPGLLRQTMFACMLMGVTAYVVGHYSFVGAVIAGACVYAALLWRLGVLTPLERGVIKQTAAALFRGRVAPP